jgi:hypothetical protein
MLQCNCLYLVTYLQLFGKTTLDVEAARLPESLSNSYKSLLPTIPEHLLLLYELHLISRNRGRREVCLPT